MTPTSKAQPERDRAFPCRHLMWPYPHDMSQVEAGEEPVRGYGNTSVGIKCSPVTTATSDDQKKDQSPVGCPHTEILYTGPQVREAMMEELMHPE